MNPSDCQPCCNLPSTIDVPGSDGAAAFTTTTANATIDAAVSFSVLDNSTFAVGEVIFVSDETDWGHFRITSLGGTTTINTTFLAYTNDGANPDVIDSGAKVVHSGTQPVITDPLPVANGGTGAASAAAAQVNLGLGQAGTADNNAGLSYDITNTASDSGSNIATVAVPDTGLYLVLCYVTVNYNGVTFTDEVLTVAVRNVTAGNYVTTCAKDTNTCTTTDYPSFDYVTPFVTASLTAGDVLQVWVDLSTVETAGSSKVTAASLLIVPLAI